jgi:hypothetical protein
VYQLTLGFAFGILGGSISSNKNWKTLIWVSIVIFLLELVNLVVGGLANIFVVSFEPGIISSIMGGLVAGMITGLVIVFLKNMDRGLARGIIFTIATVIAASSLGFTKFDYSAYTDIRTAMTIGIACLVGYMLVYYRVHLFHSPKNAVSTIKQHYHGRYIPWNRIFIFTIFAIIILAVIVIVGAVNPLVSVILSVLGLFIALWQMLVIPPTPSNKNEQT